MASSKALTRVKNNKRNGTPTSEGIFLSNNQLIALGNALKNLGSVDGALFMIGREDLPGGGFTQSVEILAYENIGIAKKVYREGHLTINIGRAEANSPNSVVINNNVPSSQTYSSAAPVPAVPAGAVAFDAGITRGSQRTPPPSIDL